ncbi:MAG: hypothetical protein RBU45_03095 [Myxococcota bacterium]|nr:hypothetical protein [Myxococcota bacterium]
MRRRAPSSGAVGEGAASLRESVRLWATSSLLALSLVGLPTPAAGAAGPPALSATAIPVLLLHAQADPGTTAEQLEELRAALARGFQRQGRFQLLQVPPELGGIDAARCVKQDCLRASARRRAGLLLGFTVSAQDKDYSFRLLFTDAADSASRRELVGTCDICSFGEACRTLEELVAAAQLPNPAVRLGPMPIWGATPAAVVPLETGRALAPDPALAAALAPGGVDPVPPLPAAGPVAASPPAGAPSPTPRPALVGAAVPAPGPPGWTLGGGSIGHSSRAAGWGVIGVSSALLLASVAAFSSASERDDSGDRAAGSTLLTLGLAGAVTGAILIARGNVPPPGVQRPDPAPATPPSGGPAERALVPTLLLEADRLGVGLAGRF